jgi:hypothetical protein
MNPLEIIYVLASVTAFYVVFARMKAHEARLTRLETRQPGKLEPKAVPAQTKQVFEKPIVPGAKEVQPLPIGGGRLKFDNENQVAEWV